MGQAFTRARKPKAEATPAPTPAPAPPPKPLSVNEQLRILMEQTPTPPPNAPKNALGQLLLRMKQRRQESDGENNSDNNFNANSENSNDTPINMKYFYSNAPLSVQEEFSSVRERLEKGESTVFKIYKMTSDYNFITEVNGVPVTYEKKLIEDLYSWSTNEKLNGYFLSDLVGLCNEKLRDMYIQGGLEQCSFLFLLFGPPMEIVGFAMLMSSMPYYNENQDALFLHSICAEKGKRYGERILLALLEVARRIPNKEILKGEAVFSSVEFYKKYKFKVKQPCRGNYNDCVITYDLHPTGGTRKLKRSRKNKKTRKN